MKRIYKTSFDAAHKIEGHKKCGQLHGHTYHVIIKIEESNPKNWVDFHIIKEKADSTINSFYDHKNLGSCTCEQIAKDIHDRLFPKFKLGDISVTVFETEHFGVEYP